VSCPRTQELLAAAIDSELSADTQHVAGCCVCQREQRAIEALLAALQEPGSLGDDQDVFTARVLAKLEEQPARTPDRRTWHSAFALACAAAVLLLWSSRSVQSPWATAGDETSARAALNHRPEPTSMHAAIPASALRLTSGLDRLVEQFAADGDFVSAERACAESLAIKAQTLGREHPAVAAQRATWQILVRLTTDA
jgi:hypothetical protein